MRYPNVEVERKKLGLSKPDLAKAINIGLSTYYNMQNGEVEPPLKHFVAMAKLFKVSIDYLAREEDTPNLAR